MCCSPFSTYLTCFCSPLTCLVFVLHLPFSFLFSTYLTRFCSPLTCLIFVLHLPFSYLLTTYFSRFVSISLHSSSVTALFRWVWWWSWRTWNQVPEEPRRHWKNIPFVSLWNNKTTISKSCNVCDFHRKKISICLIQRKFTHQPYVALDTHHLTHNQKSL